MKSFKYKKDIIKQGDKVSCELELLDFKQSWLFRTTIEKKIIRIDDAKIYIDPCDRLWLCQNIIGDSILDDKCKMGYKYAYNIGYIDSLMNIKTLKRIK